MTRWRAPHRPGSTSGRTAEGGSSLIAMMFVTLSLAAVSLAYVVVVPKSLQATRERMSRAKARYWALEGTARARLSLQAGKEGNFDGNAIDGTVTPVTPPAEPPAEEEGTEGGGGGEVVTGGNPAFAGMRDEADGTFRVRTTALPDGTYLIESAAVLHGVVQRIAQVVRRKVISPYTEAVFATSGIGVSFAEDIASDSYDSKKGSWFAQEKNEHTTDDGRVWRYVRKRGTLASDGDIGLPDGAVFGSVRWGPGGSYSATENTYVVGGTSAPATEEKNLAPTLWDVPAANDNGLLGAYLDEGGTYFASPWTGGGGTAVIPPGTYVLQNYYSYFKPVVVQGDVTIYVKNHMWVGWFSSLILEPGAKLRIFHQGNWLEIGGYGLINQTGSPANARVYMNTDPDGDGVGFGSSASLTATNPFVGVLHAPKTYVELRQREVLGSLVVDVLQMNFERIRLHYDERLAELEDEAPRTIRYENVASWWMTP